MVRPSSFLTVQVCVVLLNSFSVALIEEIATRAKEMACEKEIGCCVRGYHVYKDIWAAAIGEVLVCSQEPTNAQNFSL